MTKDYRLPENRKEYFTALYKMNLEHGVMPGLVYLYMPELARRYGWDAEQKLWFAFLNGLTQNPITSLRLLTRLPMVPPASAQLTHFNDWFNVSIVYFIFLYGLSFCFEHCALKSFINYVRQQN